jgi:predicted nucleotidyltransferase
LSKFAITDKSLLQHIPETHRHSLQRAVEILQQAGCAQIFLFGSLATGQMGMDSDIDLAIRGCPKGEFFHLLGQLMLELDHPVDLVSLDNQDAFARYLEQEGELVRIG